MYCSRPAIDCMVWYGNGRYGMVWYGMRMVWYEDAMGWDGTKYLLRRQQHTTCTTHTRGVWTCCSAACTANPNPCCHSSSMISAWRNSKSDELTRVRSRALYSVYAAAATASTLPLRKLDLEEGLTPSHTMMIRHTVNSNACARSELRTVYSSSVLGMIGEGLVVMIIVRRLPRSSKVAALAVSVIGPPPVHGRVPIMVLRRSS